MLRWTIVNFHHIIQSRLEEGKLAEDHYQEQTCRVGEREKGTEMKKKKRNGIFDRRTHKQASEIMALQPHKS